MTPEQQAIIISQSAQGIPGCKIAQGLGVHESTVSRSITQPDTRARIQAEAEKIINGGLRVARQATLRASAETLRQYKSVSAQQPYDKDLIKLGLDASKTVLAVAGLTGQPSTVINTLININQGSEQAPALNILRQFMQAKACKAIDIQNCVTNDIQQDDMADNSLCHNDTLTGIAPSRTDRAESAHRVTSEEATDI